MKNTLKKVLAFLLVFSFVFAFAACNDDKDKETTTVAETTAEGDTTTVEDTTVVGDTTTVEATTVEGGTTTAGTTVIGDTTTAAAAITAPVGSDIAKVVEFYNQYANATKSYTGKVTVTKTDGTTTTIGSVTGGDLVKNLLVEKLPQDYKPKDTLTFNNGKATNKDGNTVELKKHLPRDTEATMSVLQPAGVASASCVQEGSGWKVTINLKPETVGHADGEAGIADVNQVPKYTSQCMDTLSMKPSDLEPATVKNALVRYYDCKIVAVINDKGLLTKLDINTPAEISGNLNVKFVVNIPAKITLTGLYKGNYTFAY